MDGLKEIRQGAALPAVDAACPGSLEISGHCLAAARVIALLLVGPEKKRAQDKRMRFKTGRKKKETEEKRVEINSWIFYGCRGPWDKIIFAFTPNLQQLRSHWNCVLTASHRAVIRNKHNLCRVPSRGGQRRWCSWKKEAVDPVELTCLVCAQLKCPLLSANYCCICIFIISI